MNNPSFPNNHRFQPADSTNGAKLSNAKISNRLKNNQDKEDQAPNPFAPHLGLDSDNSVELCPFKLDKDQFRKTIDDISFFSQWEPDEDDLEEKRLLEYLERNQQFKQTGTVHEELFHSPQGFSPELRKMNDSPQAAAEDMRGYRNASKRDVGVIQQNKAEQCIARRRVTEGEPAVVNDPEESNKIKHYGLAITQKKSLKLGDTLMTEYIPNIDSEKTSPQKSPQKPENISPRQFGSKKRSEGKPSSKKKHRAGETEQSGLNMLLDKREQDLIKHVYFNIIVVGSSGIGKSTFVDAFLKKKFKINQVKRPSTREIHEFSGERLYKDMNFKMKLIDTPGYGPLIPHAEWYKMIKSYLKKQFEEYHSKRKESKHLHAVSSSLEDRRVHACLYFISGPRISHLDLIYMKKLQKYTTIIPVLAKGDAYTAAEAKEIKMELTQQAYDAKVEFFDFSQALKDHPNMLKKLIGGKFGPSPPFLMISSVDKIYISENKYIYGREYSWGVCDIKNPEHSDFLMLSNLLGGYICFDCIGITNSLYHQYLKREKKKNNNLTRADIIKKGTFGIGALTMGAFGAYMYLKFNKSTHL